MTLSWLPAKVDGFGIFVALAGTSTTGKTYSALRMGRGICSVRGGDLAVLDTEGGRVKHYAREFSFKLSEMQPPFHPDRFAEAAIDAEEKGFGCLIIDNFSLEWSGSGGVLDLQEAELSDLVARDKRDMPEETKRFRHLRQSWIEPKKPHKRMMQTLLQRRIPIIFCIRANLVVETDDDGKKKPERWKPDQDSRFIYEWTVAFTLHPATPGRPRTDLPYKCEPQHQPIFPVGEFITEEAGASLWRWAAGGPQSSNTAPGTDAGAAAASAQAPAAAGGHPAAATGSDVFPGDLPSIADADTRQDVAYAKAEEFVVEIEGVLRKQHSQEHIRVLMAKKDVRHRMDRLLQTYPALHQRVLAVVSEHTRKLGAAA